MIILKKKTMKGYVDTGEKIPYTDESDRRAYLSFVLELPLQVLAGTGGSCPVGMYLHLPCSLLRREG